MTEVQQQNTELKIKEAARALFQQRGFVATKTRDIAEAANTNLALVNYYFRNKKKLFDLIMTETLSEFFAGLSGIINEPDTSLRQKLDLFVERYIDFLHEHPNVPAFILTEIRANPQEFVDRLGVAPRLRQSVLMEQILQEMENGKLPPIHPTHFFMNLSALVVFPFVAKPMIHEALGTDDQAFTQLMEERKRLIPQWIEAMLRVN